MQYPNFTMVGQPYTNPNFQMVGGVNQVGARFNPYVVGNPMMGTSAGALVPTAPGMPPVAPGVPGMSAGLGGTSEAVLEDIVKEAVEEAAKDAKKPGKVSKLGKAAKSLGKTRLGAMATSPLGLAGLGLGAALYNDPGEAKHFDEFMGINPNDEPDDLGITSVAKSAMRGTAHAGNQVEDAIDWVGENSPLFNIPEWLFSTKEERDAEDSAKEVALYSPGGMPIEAQGGMPQGGGSGGGGGSMEFPQGGDASSAGVQGSLDQLLSVMMGMKPQKGVVPEKLNADLRELNYLKALDWGLPTNGTLMARIAAGNKEADVRTQLQALELDKDFASNTKSWMEDYAKTAVDIEKEKRQAADDDFKIHSTRGGFLIETTENGKKVLKPISPFGDGSSSSKNFTVAGRKFNKNNPLAGELAVLQNLSDVGILNDFLVENQKDLAGATKGLTDEKQIQEAKVLAVARAMKSNPQLKATLQQKYLSAVGSVPSGQPVYDMETMAPPSAEDVDWLTALTEGKK